MPRIPIKAAIGSGCRAGAMHGRTRCRSHLDHRLGLRDAGAPPGNLNALRHGRHSRPLRSHLVERPAHKIWEDPDDLHVHIALAPESIQRSASDPYKTILALRVLLG